MILRDVELVNIRSHKEARIVFSSGITLFEGDVGSGKSSILMAVEFALFGLGSQRPEALLSQGAPSGSVRLRFEVDGAPYEVKRQLKRAAGRIGQDKKESYFARGADVENLAPSELKERILGILGFNEPKGPRAASRIFRYAVYTPQGEMRRVLSDAKERLGTVRRAFDMESYDTARENARALRAHIDMEAARLEGRFAGMVEAEARAAEAKKEIAAAEARAAEAKEALDAAAADEKGIADGLAALRERAAERDVLRERAAGLGRQAAESKRRAASLRGQADEAAAALAELDGRIERFEAPVRPTDREDGAVSAEIDALRAVRSKMDAAEARAAVLRRQIAGIDAEMSGIDPDAADRGAAGKRDAARAASSAAAEARRIASEGEDVIRGERDVLRERAAERDVLRERAAGLGRQAAESKRRAASLRGQADEAAAALAELDGRIERFEAPVRPTDREDGAVSAEIDALRTVRSEMDAAEARAAVLRGQLADADALLSGAGSGDAAADAEAASEAASEAAANKRRIEADLSDARGQREALLGESSAVSTSLMKVKTEMAQARKELDRIARLGSKCHTCETELTAAHLARIRGEREAVIERCGNEASRLDAEQGRLDAELGRTKSLAAALEGDLRAAADAEQAAADAEQAAAEARRTRDRLAAERDSKSGELEAALAEAAGLRGRYATDRAADRFECGDSDPVGYLLKLREALAAHADALARLAELRERAAMARRDMDSRRADAAGADADARSAESSLAAAESGLGAFDGLDAEVSEAELGLAAAQGRRRRAEAEAATHAESASGWRRRLEAEDDTLERARRSRDEHGRLVQYSHWIESYFVPSLERIEGQVLTSLQAGLDEAYRGWFATLVDDETKTSRIDDTFMPIVDQDGYEVDLAHLSGGERTSVSLAYRLALNTLLRRETRSLRSNLLILDEPTDGFSKPQLDKVHSILKALEYEQIIIVSHDRELEAHADHVFHVTKEGGSSSVRAA